VTRAELQQLLNAMREQRRGPGARSSKDSKPKGFDPRDRRLPRIPHLTPVQVKEYMDNGKCFNCASKEHLSRDCPQQKKPVN
jgi:Zinc knuckle